MASIESMLMGASTDDEKARMLADSLRGQKRAADLFSMSTISPLAGAARAESQNVMDSAKCGGVLREARQRSDALKAQRDQQQSNWERDFAYKQKNDAAGSGDVTEDNMQLLLAGHLEETQKQFAASSKK